MKSRLQRRHCYDIVVVQKFGSTETAKSRHIFQDFINATADITITDKDVLVKFQKRAHNPFLLASGFGSLKTPIPWWDNKILRFQFG